SRAPLVRMLVTSRRSLWTALLCLAVGCSHPGSLSPQELAERILPPPDVPAPGPPEAPVPTPQTGTGEGNNSGDVEGTAGQTPPGPNASSQPVTLDRVPCGPLTLPDAIALAFRLQPQLRASLESIQQARGREDIAFAAFLPTLTGGYSVGG